MSDVELILQIQKEIQDDPNPASLTQELDPLDPVAIELMLLESDNAIEVYMAGYRAKYRGLFEAPEVFDNFVLEQQTKARKSIKEGLLEVQQKLAELGYGTELRNPFEEEN
jgi:hypothetical protein